MTPPSCPSMHGSRRVQATSQSTHAFYTLQDGVGRYTENAKYRKAFTISIMK